MLLLDEKIINKNVKQLRKSVGQEVSITYVDRSEDPDLRGLFFPNYKTIFGTVLNIFDGGVTLKTSKNHDQIRIPLMSVAGFVVLPKLPNGAFVGYENWRQSRARFAS